MSLPRNRLLVPLAASLGIHAALGAATGGLVWLRARPSASGLAPARAGAELLGVSLVGGHAQGSLARTLPRPPVRAEADAAVAAGAPATAATPAAKATASAVAAGAGAAQAASAASAAAGAAQAAALDAYAALVRARIGEHLAYPLSLRRRGIEGRVGLALTVDAGGRLASQEVAQSSGFFELDQLALEAARAAEPYPLPVGGLSEKTGILLRVPIEFRLSGE